MEIDQAKLGLHIQEQMEAIENDQDVPDDAEIGAIVTIVEIGKEATDPDEGDGFRNLRVRSNLDPLTAIGLLEEAKALQLDLLG